MGKHTKQFLSAKDQVDGQTPYELEEALALVRRTARAKFSETVDVAFRLGVDPRKGEQQVRGTVVLPHGTGKTPRVAAFAQGEAAREAEQAGADVVGAEELVQRVESGWSDFDVLVAHPDMMKMVARLGKKLGPRTPNKKSGTVSENLGQTVRELKLGKVEFRTDRGGIVHSVLGKSSFEPDQLRENFVALLDSIVRAKPPSAKGTYLRSITLSATMGPGVKVDPQRALAMIRR